MKNRIPGDARPYSVRRDFADRIIQAWLDILKLTQAQISLSEEDTQALTTYLEIQKMILDCRKAAIRVTPQVWQGIEARMLRPPELPPN